MKGGLSVLVWSAVAFVALLVAIGLLIFYIYQVPRLVDSGTQNQVFYLLLIPWALAAAAFLFGAMESYAHYTYKKMGNALELGGPVVLFCLVLVGGFKLVPAAPDAFDLTVRAHSTDESAPMIDSGQVTLDLGNNRRTESFERSGEANFKGIPTRLLNTRIRVLPQVDGYASRWRLLQIQGKVLDISIEKAETPRSIPKGSVEPPPASQDLTIVVDGQQSEAKADKFGRFEIPVDGKDGDRVRIRAFVGKKVFFDDFRTLPGPVTIPFRKGN